MMTLQQQQILDGGRTPHWKSFFSYAQRHIDW